jgi:hypothetical protein
LCYQEEATAQGKQTKELYWLSGLKKKREPSALKSGLDHGIFVTKRIRPSESRTLC